jgi:predicted ribosomally synthesized peptide with SipW-like signal peptide
MPAHVAGAESQVVRRYQPARTVCDGDLDRRQLMKKIALASAAMGGVALFAFGASGTFASFTDTEAVTGSAGAGSLDLTVGSGPVATATAAMALTPGQSTTQSYWVNNAGTVAGTLSADLSIVSDAENNCTDPENESGDTTCGWGTNGEFSKFATVQFETASATTADACKTATFGTAVAPAVALKTAADAGPANVFPINGGTGKCVVFKLTLPETASNVVQGDTAQFKADLTLTQLVEKGEVTAPIAQAPAGDLN